MRSMGRALLLLLVVAFVAGVWDARSGEEATPGRSPAPFGTEPVERIQEVLRQRLEVTIRRLPADRV